MGRNPDGAGTVIVEDTPTVKVGTVIRVRVEIDAVTVVVPGYFVDRLRTAGTKPRMLPSTSAVYDDIS
jgi:hypothetical protein